ncbi:hypothetical protein CBL_04475 [Carabus blaptoides fortunei]
MVQQAKKRTNANRTTTSGSGSAKGAGTSVGKECAVARAGMSANQVFKKKAYKRYLKKVAEYARLVKPQEQQQQQRAQRKLLEKEKNLQKFKRKVFCKLLSQAKLHTNSTYQDFVKQYGQDERFQSVASPEDLFREHVNKLRKLEMKAEESQRQDQVAKNGAVPAIYRGLIGFKSLCSFARCSFVTAHGTRESLRLLLSAIAI